MGFYENKVLLHLIDWMCSVDLLVDLRQRVVLGVNGAVLEGEMGSGLDLSGRVPFQSSHTRRHRVVGILGRRARNLYLGKSPRAAGNRHLGVASKVAEAI